MQLFPCVISLGAAENAVEGGGEEGGTVSKTTNWRFNGFAFEIELFWVIGSLVNNAYRTITIGRTRRCGNVRENSEFSLVPLPLR